MKWHCSIKDSRNTTKKLLKALPREMSMSRVYPQPAFMLCKTVQRQVMQVKTGFSLPVLDILDVCVLLLTKL